MEKINQRDKALCVGVIDKVVREGFSEEVTFHLMWE